MSCTLVGRLFYCEGNDNNLLEIGLNYAFVNRNKVFEIG